MKKNWLLTYNLLQAIGWAISCLWLAFHWNTPDATGIILLSIFQFSAVLEILHVALKWIKSPFVTTTIQVCSRLFIMALIDLLYFQYPELLTGFPGLTGLHCLIIAWGVTEVVRYLFYFTGLLGKEIPVLLWMRYSFFLVLYPLGVTGEFLIMAATAEINDYQMILPNIILLLIAGGYVVFFPRMYKHMLVQRKKKL